VDGSRWDGKIRLIGFVDVFFLICYSGESRFEKGIIIYKDDGFIRDILQQTKVTAAELGLEVTNKDEIVAAREKGRGTDELDSRMPRLTNFKIHLQNRFLKDTSSSRASGVVSTTI
jgi:hypothetical protein